jgi:hypothetical protein
MNTVKKATDELGDLTGYPPNENLQKLRDKLRSYGLCAIGGEADSEAVFIRRPDGLVEENHAVFFGNGSWTGSGSGKFMGCHSDGSEPPPPTGCPPPKPPHVKKFIIKKHNNLWDATAKTCDQVYCASIGSDQICCPARLEGDPNRVVCEQEMVGGDPVWSGDGNVKPTDNPYQVRCSDCTWLQICSVDGTVCDSVRTDG